MAGSIKGIIVEIGGDTSGLQKALKNVNSATSSLTKELRGVNSLLKLDPTDTELVAQKQTILAQNIEETSEKLKILKEAQQKADDAIKNGTQISDENYRNLQREIINTENKLKDLKAQASNWTTVGKSLEEVGNKITNISKKLDTMGSTLTTTLTLPVLAIGTAAVTTGNDFEAQMSRVQAIAGATGDELEKLTEQAMQLGAETSFSASEVAQGMENLASAGFTTEEIMEAMPGLLDLAASSGAELATSSEIAASAIRGFGLEASEAGHVADVFAEAAARTNAQTEDMGEAMKYIAPVANTMGLKIEEVAAAIGIMSDAGIKGSQAGTSLRGALTRLTKPTDKMLGVMEDLGISFYDNEGKMKSLTEMISMLQDATKDLTDEQTQNALTVLFGTESLSGMVALINRGSDDLSDMTKSFEDADGAAADMADTMLDNTSGSLESLSGSLETAGIAIQKALVPEIKKLAKWIQDLVDDFSDLSEEEQLNILKTVGLVAAIGPAIKILSKITGTIGTATKGIGIFSQAIAVATNKATSSSSSVNKLASAFQFLSSPIGIATAALGLLVAGFVAFIAKSNETAFSLEETTKKLESAKQAQDEFNQSVSENYNTQMSEIENIEALSKELSTLVDKNGKVKDGYEGRVKFILNELNPALGTEYKLNGKIIDSYDELKKSIDELIQKKRADIILSSEEEKYNEAINKKAEAYDNLATTQEELAYAQERYEEAKKTDKQFDGGAWKAQVEEAQKNVDAAKEIYDSYLNDIANYEKDYETIMTGSNEEIEELINKRTYTYKSSSGDMGEVIAHNIQQVQSEIDYYKTAYATDLANKDKYNAEKNLKQKQANEEELKKLAQQLFDMTSTTEELTPYQIEAWKSLATGSYDIYKEYINKMSPEMQKEINKATGVISNDTQLISETGKLASNARDIFRNDTEGEESGKSFLNDLWKGITNSDYRNEVTDSVTSLAKKIISSFEDIAQGKKSGKDFIKGIQEGISNTEIQSNIFSTVWNLGKNILASLNNSLDEHSPSRLSEESGINFVQGIIKGTASKEREALNLVGKFGKDLINKFNGSFDSSISALPSANLSSKVIDSTKTIFTTPQIVFNVQELDEAKLQQCFNYVNKKFGSQY